MSERPPIPEEIRRKVLVESGHRCAIHTCKNPDVDIHHIIPYEKCKEHAFENLIALCPNCHRRAHIDEIDRKALLMYKAQLITRSADQEVSESLSTPALHGNPWDTIKLNCEEFGSLKFSVEIEFPQFKNKNDDFTALNAIFAGEAYSSLLDERSNANGVEIEEDEWWAKLGNAYASSYSISLFSDEILSVRTSIYTYGAGAAHGNHATFGKNFLLNPLRKLDLIGCFADPPYALSAISDYCISHLERENHDQEPNDWVRRGASAEWGNFDSFYVTSNDLVIVFQPYEVGCFAEGEREVPLGPRFLSPLLATQSPLRTLWGLT
jgi:hypothetical protein